MADPDDIGTRLSSKRSQHRIVGPLFAKAKQNFNCNHSQFTRLSQINNTSSLANRINRGMPASTNFPDHSIRERASCSGFNTFTKFNLSEAENVFFNDSADLSSMYDRRDNDINIHQVSAAVNKNNLPSQSVTKS